MSTRSVGGQASSNGAVTLRRIERDDAPALERAIGEQDIARISGISDPADPRRVSEWVAAHCAVRMNRRVLAIAEEGTRELVGTVTIIRRRCFPSDQRAELGYWLLPAARGRGAATRALALASTWAFAKMLDVWRLELLIEPANLRSQQVAERAGYTREGVLRGYRDLDGEKADFCVYSLLRSDVAEEH